MLVGRVREAIPIEGIKRDMLPPYARFRLVDVLSTGEKDLENGAPLQGEAPVAPTGSVHRTWMRRQRKRRGDLAPVRG